MTGPDTIGDVLLLENFGLNIGKLAFKGIPELFEGLKGVGCRLWAGPLCGRDSCCSGRRRVPSQGRRRD